MFYSVAKKSGFARENPIEEDVVLDESAFAKAAEDFENLSNQLESLSRDVEEMLSCLKEGFDTPAGVKFINSCEKALIRPLEEQRLVLAHIKDTLYGSKKMYQTIFNEYEVLQNTINKAKNI